MEYFRVMMYCPFSKTEELVYFYPVQEDGKWYVSRESFNGCDNNWHKCQECEKCKELAWDNKFGTT